MATFLMGFGVILLAVGGLAAGVVLGRAPLKGSCGGLACGGACSACPRKKAEDG